MNSEAQFLTLLEWMGWKRLSACAGQVEWWGRWVKGNPNPVETSTSAPMFTLDLIHEAERVFVNDASLWGKYCLLLMDILVLEVGQIVRGRTVHSSKEHRLEALLKTNNLWIFTVTSARRPE